MDKRLGNLYVAGNLLTLINVLLYFTLGSTTLSFGLGVLAVLALVAYIVLSIRRTT